jgi:hypothetical protein
VINCGARLAFRSASLVPQCEQGKGFGKGFGITPVAMLPAI